MGMFGEDSLEDIQTEIPNATYKTICKSTNSFRSKEKDYQEITYITWVVTMGEFTGEHLRQRVVTYPGLTAEIKAAFTTEEVTAWRNDARRVKTMLTELAISAEEWDTFEWSSLEKTEAFCDVFTNQKGFLQFNKVSLATESAADSTDDELI